MMLGHHPPRPGFIVVSKALLYRVRAKPSALTPNQVLARALLEERARSVSVGLGKAAAQGPSAP